MREREREREREGEGDGRGRGWGRGRECEGERERERGKKINTWLQIPKWDVKVAYFFFKLAGFTSFSPCSRTVATNSSSLDWTKDKIMQVVASCKSTLWWIWIVLLGEETLLQVLRPLSRGHGRESSVLVYPQTNLGPSISQLSYVQYWGGGGKRGGVVDNNSTTSPHYWLLKNRHTLFDYEWYTR